MAAIAITMADVVVYMPIAFISGILGQLFRQYGLTIVAATLFSLLISFTLTPMLASRWLRHEETVSNSPWARFGRWWDYHFDRLGSGRRRDRADRGAAALVRAAGEHRRGRGGRVAGAARASFRPSTRPTKTTTTSR